jgi:predicted aspartyl protease
MKALLHPGKWRIPTWKQRRMLILIGCHLLLLSFVTDTLAQSSVSGYHFTGKRKRDVVPFELHANLIVVPIRINNSDTLNFILDTGVSITLLTDPNVAHQLGLVPLRSVKIAGAGGEGDVTAAVTLGSTVRIGNIRADNLPVLVLSEDILSLSDYIGFPIHGIFGYDLFKRFVVNIDFEAKNLTFSLPEKHHYREKREGVRLPITIEDTKPYLSAMAIVEHDKSVPIKVIVDTGAGHALSLDLGSHEEIRLPGKVVRTQLGRGLSGVINGNLGRLERLKIGNYILDNVVTSFPDSSSFNLGPGRNGGRQGNVGCELLRRFNVTFNYHDNYMALKPIKKRLKETFEHDMSGMELRARGNNYRTYVIQKVMEGTPASQAGLQEGDEILFVNGSPARDIPLNDIYKLLQKKEGKEVKLIVKRGNEMFYTSFFLRRII